MINNHIILQKHLMYFRKTFYIVRNLKNKSESSPLKPSIQTHLKTPKNSPLYTNKENILVFKSNGLLIIKS